VGQAAVITAAEGAAAGTIAALMIPGDRAATPSCGGSLGLNRECKTSARAPSWAIGRERTRPHPKTRCKRRRYSVQRHSTIAAKIDARTLHTQPMPPRGALRIQTLNSPARKILHRRGPHSDCSKCDQQKTPRKPESQAGFCARGPSVSSEIYTISWGMLSESWDALLRADFCASNDHLDVGAAFACISSIFF